MKSRLLRIIFYLSAFLGVLGYTLTGFARAFNLLSTLEMIEWCVSSSGTMIFAIIIYILDNEERVKK